MNITQPPGPEPPVFVNASDGAVGTLAINYFDMVATVPQGGTYSIGPFGAGADYTDFNLDIIPAGVDWIAFKLKWGVQRTAAQAGLSLNARKNGGTANISPSVSKTQVMNVVFPAGSVVYTGMMTCIIPVDADKIYEVYWSGAFNDTNRIDLMPLGYGFNGTL